MTCSTGPLNGEGFSCFSPLLDACQGYAARSGCRMRQNSFDAVMLKDSENEDDWFDSPSASQVDPLRDVKLSAASVVNEFRDRLQRGEPGLVEEIERASFALATESVRKTIVAACQTHNLWPPTPAPEGIDASDGSYEDTLAPLNVIAQRAYNNEALANCGSQTSVCHGTASFLLDFARDVGVTEPKMSEIHQHILSELAARITEWEAVTVVPSPSPSTAAAKLDSVSRSNNTCGDSGEGAAQCSAPHYELQVQVLAASDMSIPTYRTLTRTLSGPDSFHVELQLGSQRQATIPVEISPHVRSVDFAGNQRLNFAYTDERALLVRVHSGTVLCGHPCIGEAALPLGSDLRDSETRLLQVHLEHKGGHAGKVLLQYRMLLILQSSIERSAGAFVGA